MVTPRTVFRGTFYFITCAPSQTIAKQQCAADWEIIPTPERFFGPPAMPNPHACTCGDSSERPKCRHYQFQSPRRPPKTKTP